MRKQVIKLGIILVLCMACIKLGVINSIMAFLFAGIIPGTPYSIPSSVMLLASITLLWLFIIGIVSAAVRLECRDDTIDQSSNSI